jgi:hypothetical protein
MEHMQQSELSRFWTPIYNAFHPFGVLDSRKLHAWYVPRPDNVRRELRQRFNPERPPSRIVFGGHPSSGKTTELLHFLPELEQTGYNAIFLNLEQNLSRFDEANSVEVLFLIGAAIYRAAEEAQLKPDRSRLDDLAEGLETIVQTHTGNKQFKLNLDELLKGMVMLATFALPSGVAQLATKAIDAMRPLSFVSGTDLETVRKLEVQPEIETMVKALNRILEDVSNRTLKPIVLLVDGLDKVRPDAADTLFNASFLADVDCRVVYTAPPSIFYHPRYIAARRVFRVMPFPNIRLRHKDDNRRDDSGFGMLTQVVHRRLDDLGYAPQDVIRDDALETLIEGSSGLIRELVMLVQDATIEAEGAGKTVIELPDATKAVNASRRDYEARLRPNARRLLREVCQTRQMPDLASDDVANLALCDDLLFGNYALSYINDDVWFDVHNILRDRICS